MAKDKKAKCQHVCFRHAGIPTTHSIRIYLTSIFPVEAVRTSCAYPAFRCPDGSGFVSEQNILKPQFQIPTSINTLHFYLRNEYGEYHLRIKGYGNLYLIPLRQEKYNRS